MSAGPLDGITIVDFSRVLSGPYCTMLAADMGARVIKVEHPERGDDTRAWGPPFLHGESAYYLSTNRNKESVAVDFKTGDGRAVVEELIARADVVVENFRPGTMDRAGLGYDALAARHPSLIYVAISGHGRTGPRRGEAGYDAVAQAEGGLMSITGTTDGPAVRLGVAIADIAAGMFAFQGLLLALIARGRSGRGQLVDVSLLDSVAAVLTYQAGKYLLTGDIPHRTGNRHTTIAPYDTFDACDGVLVLAVGNDRQWRDCCDVLDLGELAGDARLATNAGRVTYYEDLVRPPLAAAVASRALGALVEALRGRGVPCGAVRSLDEVFADPQVAARGMIETVHHTDIGPMKMLGLPVKLSDTPGSVRQPPPGLGEHTRRVLTTDLGLSEARVQELIESGIVSEPRASGSRGAGTR